jgi:hypothetical protein
MTDDIKFAKPEVSASTRRRTHQSVRDSAKTAKHSTFQHPVETKPNSDESRYSDECYAANFTKGLLHDKDGFVSNGYPEFVDEINQRKAGTFEQVRPDEKTLQYSTRVKATNTKPDWRGWESPRTGHYFDLEGSDADGIGMAPAPALGGAELAFEMAEVYAMAMLRDIPFCKFDDASYIDSNTGIGAAEVLACLNTIWNALPTSQSVFTRRRYAARLGEAGDYYHIGDGSLASVRRNLTGGNLFRGSGPGAQAGPWVSQFMLVGTGAADMQELGKSAAPAETCAANHTEASSRGYIAYGSQVIDQRCNVFVPQLDYMLSWAPWLDVQNGADVRSEYQLAPGRRFLSTPRDMATYVRFDALYQAYLNACLILLATNSKTQSGFPEHGALARTPFASFGGPHILSLVTEVATRCLKSARRQKFNFHRRPRPERIGGLLSVAHAAVNGGEKFGNLGSKTCESLSDMLDVLTAEFLQLVKKHNKKRTEASSNFHKSKIETPADAEPQWFSQSGLPHNLLLAMAFPEGSPMHPAYAAGHATVAGGCVTMLKAFFETVDEDFKPYRWSCTNLQVVEASEDGSDLHAASADGMTLEGELNKLAANVSIARNMAGVHYYSDYYDSLRMGERIAVSILVEQFETYDTDKVCIRFRSFDGDAVLIDRTSTGKVSVKINGGVTSYRDWWYRHMEESLHGVQFAAGEGGSKAEPV